METGGVQAFIVRLALRFHGIAIALAIIAAAYGGYRLSKAKYDVFPEFAPPRVSIQTEASGFSAEQVEKLVTTPIESAIEGASGEVRMASNSVEGLSDVSIYFDPNSNIYRDRQVVSERLAEVAGALPAGAKSPVITPLTSSAGVARVIGLTSRRRSLMSLRTLAEWTVRPALMGEPGVADVEVFGGQTSSTQVLVRPDRLLRFGLGLPDVASAVRNATSIRGLGFLSTPNQRVLLQQGGQSLTPEQLSKVVLAHEAGQSVTVGDVAHVITAPTPSIGSASIEGVPGVVMNVTEQYGANTLVVSRGVDKALTSLRPYLHRQGVSLHANLFTPSKFINVALGNLESALFIGAGLVVLVVVLFLADLRAAIICCAAIPLSLLAAVAVLQWSNAPLNTMTLAGLAIALGEVVDDAVIAVENSLRRLRQAKQLGLKTSPLKVILAAVVEVRSAVVYATFSVILVFVPVLTLSGIAGRFFAPLAVSYVAAVLCSLAVALTVTPALSLLLLPQTVGEKSPFMATLLRKTYGRFLNGCVSKPRLASGAAALLTMAGLAMFPFFDATFLPELHEGHFIVHMNAAPGTSLSESLRLGARVTSLLDRLPFVRSVAQRAGRAELTSDTHGPQQSEFEVDLARLSGRAAQNAKEDILSALSDFPGVSLSANTFLTERINETLSGETAPVSVQVFGDRLAAIDQAARRVASALGRTPGAVSTQIASPPGLPQISIKLRMSALQRWGIRPGEALDAIAAAHQGDVVGQTYHGNQSFDVLVKTAGGQGYPSKLLEGLTIRAPSGVYVPLSDLASATPATGPYDIAHVDGRRVQTVTTDVEGRSITAFASDAQRLISERVKLPAGVYLKFNDTAQAEASAQRELGFKSVIVMAGVLMLLSVVARSWRNLLLIVLNLPFALIGGVFAAFLSGGVISVGSLIGFVTLFGISVRNSIMLIAHYRHLVEIEGRKWSTEAAVEGACDRMTPIVMTSLVTGLGLAPLALGMNRPGREVEGPMAIVILGGLATSLVLNLLLLPALAARFGRFRPPEQDDPDVGSSYGAV